MKARTSLSKILLALSITAPISFSLCCAESHAEKSKGKTEAQRKSSDDDIQRALMGGQRETKEEKEKEEEEEDTEKKNVPKEEPKPLPPKPVVEGVPPDQALQKAKIDMDRNRFTEAKSILKQSLNTNQNNIQLYLCLFEVSKRAKDWSAASSALEKIMELEPAREKEFLGEYGQTLFELRRYDKAIPVFAKALPYGKDVDQIRKTLIKIALIQNDAPEATKQYQEYFKIKPNDGEMHWEFANYLYRNKKLKESIPEYKLASDNRPDDAYGHERIAYLLMIEKDYDGSILYYKRALSKKSDGRLLSSLNYVLKLKKQAAGPSKEDKDAAASNQMKREIVPKKDPAVTSPPKKDAASSPANKDTASSSPATKKDSAAASPAQKDAATSSPTTTKDATSTGPKKDAAASKDAAKTPAKKDAATTPASKDTAAASPTKKDTAAVSPPKKDAATSPAKK